jgi:exodeoxyribonuclease VII large subunit
MFDGPQAPGARMALSVAALLLAAGDALAARLGAVAVRGEISGFSRAASGHCYLTLKDSDGAAAVLRCAMFRRAAALLDFEPRDGLQVELRGRIGLYEPRGELQLVVEAMRRLGAGNLYEEFLRLRDRLQAQGLFDAARKRPPVRWPGRVAVVTSPAAAAWHDVMTALRRRAPQVDVVLVPSLVQGAEAPPALAAALQRAGQLDGVDTVLLVRGGGSLEDLWAFNDERVVRAIVACTRPVICGVGHESDLTLADLAADLRAPTPTAAAELAAPERGEALRLLQQRQAELLRAARRQLERHAQRIDGHALRLGPAASVLAAQQERLRGLAGRLRLAGQALLMRQRPELQRRAQRLDHGTRSPLALAAARLASQGERLRALDPRHVLQRGYVWVEDAAGHPVLSVRTLQPQAQVRAVWADGTALARIETIETIVAGDAGKAIDPGEPWA